MLSLWLIVKVLFKQKTMKKNKHSLITFSMALLCAIILVISSCKKNNSGVVMAGPDEYYTCSMDPQVIENKDGNCPICHMKLIKVKKNNLKAGQIKLSTQQIKLGNITYDTIRIGVLSKEVTLTGKVTIDQNFSDAISARVQGRIEKLIVKNVGDYVGKGQLLYEIYSEDLNATQREYILFVQNIVKEDRFAEAAKNKLLLYGMSESQINNLKLSNEVMQSVPIYSSKEGFVTEISITEGNYVSIGTTLFRLASLNSLWVEAQVYLPYLSYLKQGSEARFTFPTESDESYSGKVIFIDPQVQSPQRYVLARFQIVNPSKQIKPGMLANILFRTELKKSLLLLIDAIIQDSNGANVWLFKKDGVFENRMVKTGIQNSYQIEIVEGLKEGDVVVVSGAYLLNSEYIFKKGANPMEGHKDMPGMEM